MIFSSRIFENMIFSNFSNMILDNSNFYIKIVRKKNAIILNWNHLLYSSHFLSPQIFFEKTFWKILLNSRRANFLTLLCDHQFLRNDYWCTVKSLTNLLMLSFVISPSILYFNFGAKWLVPWGLIVNLKKQSILARPTALSICTLTNIF